MSRLDLWGSDLLNAGSNGKMGGGMVGKGSWRPFLGAKRTLQISLSVRTSDCTYVRRPYINYDSWFAERQPLLVHALERERDRGRRDSEIWDRERQ